MQKRPPTPAFHIPLGDEELKMVGEICAIQGQIEWLMLSTVTHLLELDQAAADAVMASTSLEANAKIWLQVIRSKRVDPDIYHIAKLAYSELKSFIKGRNDFVHVFYAKEIAVQFSEISGKAITYGREPVSDTGEIVAIRTRGRRQRLAGEIRSVRDQAGELSQKFLQVENWLLTRMR
jgi:hypothetical protein